MLLTVKQVAEMLQVDTDRVYELCRTGTLPTCRLGRQVRIRRAALEEWVQGGGTPLPGGWRRAQR